MHEPVAKTLPIEFGGIIFFPPPMTWGLSSFFSMNQCRKMFFVYHPNPNSPIHEFSKTFFYSHPQSHNSMFYQFIPHHLLTNKSIFSHNSQIPHHEFSKTFSQNPKSYRTFLKIPNSQFIPKSIKNILTFPFPPHSPFPFSLCLLLFPPFSQGDARG